MQAADSLIGMTVPAAVAHVGAHPVSFQGQVVHSIRVVEQDGQGLMATMDFRPERLNVAIAGGNIVRLINLG